MGFDPACNSSSNNTSMTYNKMLGLICYNFYSNKLHWNDTSVMPAFPVIPDSATSDTNTSAPAKPNTATSNYITHSALVLRSRSPDYWLDVFDMTSPVSGFTLSYCCSGAWYWIIFNILFVPRLTFCPLLDFALDIVIWIFFMHHYCINMYAIEHVCSFSHILDYFPITVPLPCLLLT